MAVVWRERERERDLHGPMRIGQCDVNERPPASSAKLASRGRRRQKPIKNLPQLLFVAKLAGVIWFNIALGLITERLRWRLTDRIFTSQAAAAAARRKGRRSKLVVIQLICETHKQRKRDRKNSYLIHKREHVN